jgi:endo-1,4-beta-xylanase
MFRNIKTNASFLKLVSLTILAALVAGALFIPATAAPTGTPTGQRLRTLAGSFLIGYASRTGFNTMSDSATYKSVAASEFNILTPENDMKIDATEPQQNVFTFTAGDEHIAFAQANNMKVHGHTLVWHSQVPTWLSGGTWTATTLTNVMYNHIDNVMGHYAGQVYVWDVVNEAFEDSGAYRASFWYTTIGASYIEKAFQRARAADSTAFLVYNDYNIEALNAKSDAVYNMIADFKNRGIPIDGVGFQMHLTEAGINPASLASNMQRFADLGVDIYITEMDVRIPKKATSTDLANQATIYQNVLDKCLLQPRCKALQVWGIPDKYSWVMDFFPGKGAPLLFDDNYNAKPAYYSVQTRLANTPPTATPGGPTPTRTNTPGPTATPGAPGMHIGSINVAIQIAGGGRRQGVSTVRIVDQNNNAVSGATVEGQWSGAATDTDSGSTDSNGTVVKFSNFSSAASGTFTYCVTNVTKSGVTYQSGANVATCASASY